MIPEGGRHSRELLSIMSPIGYCFNIVETLPNLLTVFNSDSRKQMQFSLLVTGLFRSASEAWKGLMRACLPSKPVAGWDSRYSAGGCFTPVPLRCSSATGQPGQGRRTGCGVPTTASFKCSSHSFFAFSIAFRLFLFCCICHD